ncbi:GH92 family glycosyl hydrolase [Paraflavitalea pollutisoli]|uniref:GH92 family glycosyl hydrolase n=1 Tax=Paraflavitalea pollutisoli TaxID=3034143 RepID=UPI0023EB8F29|nr:GH92 family glycosyl hydrolase [Paraflavitalea sp. H1-2-19X]
MKKLLLWALLISPASTLLARQPARSVRPEPAKSVLDYVDPTIGSVGHLLEPTRPTIQLPNQMIRVAPQRKDYLDNQIASFPLNIVSHRLGQVFAIKPSVKPVTAQSWQARYTWDHDLEVNHPWHYSTWLLDDEIGVEFTPGRKTGIYRFRFPPSAHKAILLDGYNGDEGQYHFSSTTEVTGYETWHGDIKVYLYGTWSVPGKPGTLANGQLQTSQTVTGKGAKAWISFPATTNEVELRYALSYVSAEQARLNYAAELTGKSFTTIVAQARKAWETDIGQIQVAGGTEAQKRSFYTALYRCYERMVDITEGGCYYSGYNKQVNKDQRPFYVDDWAWDTYLAHHPLRMILNPKQEEDMLQSYVRMYEQSGWMPTFPVLFGDHACMNGFHSSVVFLDAWRKGLRNFDIQKAYAGMRKNATDATIIPWRNGPKTALDDFYHSKGYFPALSPGEKETEPLVDNFEKRQAVAVTLGTSYDDWALAQLAKDLGKQADYELFTPRGQNYRNLWHPEKKFFLPKDKHGNWINIDLKFDGGPGGRDYYDENNGYTYLWQVQQDIPDLIRLMGGRQTFEERLDQLFREGLGRGKHEFWNKFPDATGLVGQFSMGNEPSFHIPWLYNYTASPWKTQKAVRFLLDVWFKDNVFGIPGDEDGGGMTAFVVFASMGFYPVTPGQPLYTIGSPLFSKVAIQLQNGKQFRLTANNSSVQNKYIQSAKMNGIALNTPWFTHDQLMNGGHLELEMGPKPNKRWGTATAGF